VNIKESIEVYVDAAIEVAIERDTPVEVEDMFDEDLLREFEAECRKHGDPNCKFLKVEALAHYIKTIGEVCAEFAERDFPQPIKVQLASIVGRAQEASKVVAACWYIIECADDFFFCDVKHTQYLDELERIRRFVMKMRKPPQRK
jgi:hypothetical protein